MGAQILLTIAAILTVWLALAVFVGCIVGNAIHKMAGED